jgi:hypothetical protein
VLLIVNNYRRTNMKCLKCKNEHDGTFGSGKYCNRGCANARTPSKARNLRISEGLKSSELVKEVAKKRIKTYECISCGMGYKRFNKSQKCSPCRRVVTRIKDINSIESMYELSSRTASKMLRRAKHPCSICGWDKSSCDVHHIIEKCNGGTNDHDNLVCVCPNCHRVIHTEKTYSREYLRGLSLSITFSNWRDYYHPSN